MSQVTITVAPVKGARYFNVYRSMPTGKRMWREVVHIEDRVGPNGGRYWTLTLACGHLKAVRRRRGNPGVPQFKPRFAPKRVRCLACREPGPPTLVGTIPAPPGRPAGASGTLPPGLYRVQPPTGPRKAPRTPKARSRGPSGSSR